MTSFSRIPDRSAAPPERTVCTETGLSPDNVKPNPDCSSRLTISVLVLSVVDEGEDDALAGLLLGPLVGVSILVHFSLSLSFKNSICGLLKSFS